MGYEGSALKLRLVRGTDEYQIVNTLKIVRKYMKDSVVRPAVNDQMQGEVIARIWERAASVGR